jgi:HsdM N-terminal domain
VRAMPLTLSELKSHLWNCAEILRGSAVDRRDWKAYILPLLFFKRICDVWDEESRRSSRPLRGTPTPSTSPRSTASSFPKVATGATSAKKDRLHHVWPCRCCESSLKPASS